STGRRSCCWRGCSRSPGRRCSASAPPIRRRPSCSACALSSPIRRRCSPTSGACSTARGRCAPMPRPASASCGAGRRGPATPATAGLLRLCAELTDPAPLLAHVRRVLDRKGQVRDDASPRLGELRREVQGARERLYGRLEQLRSQHLDLFGEETVPLRGGRLLLVLSAGARGRLPGLVHGRSASGRSFYFEPLDAVEDNNQLQTAMEEQEAERRRLLA